MKTSIFNFGPQCFMRSNGPVFFWLITVMGFLGIGSELAIVGLSEDTREIGPDTVAVTRPDLRDVSVIRPHSAVDGKVTMAMKARLQEEYGKLPLTFEVNQGQESIPKLVEN